ncbi:hypothetical protein, partial [uncultured Delftia sp.]|uniref:hypothetical protein n=1 Tax=uncultured Delftia sp. TaxID=191464 RepID=UPI002592AA63
VHHGVAQGDQGIHAAQDQSVDDLLKQYVHMRSPLLLRMETFSVPRIQTNGASNAMVVEALLPHPGL